MSDLACTHCGKRLSRKSARQIDGVIMCSTCMFKPASRRMIASVTGTGTAETRNVAQGEACQNGPQGDAQNTPQVSDNEL